MDEIADVAFEGRGSVLRPTRISVNFEETILTGREALNRVLCQFFKLAFEEVTSSRPAIHIVLSPLFAAK